MSWLFHGAGVWVNSRSVGINGRIPANLINDTSPSALSQVASSFMSWDRRDGDLDEPVSSADSERGVSGRVVFAG